MKPNHDQPTRRERAIVLGPPGLFLILPGLCAGIGLPVAPLMITAAIWIVLASLVLALRRGLRQGDWSAFRPPADSTPEHLDWDTRTGSYTWLGE